MIAGNTCSAVLGPSVFREECKMPQLIFLVLAIVVAWYGYRLFIREAERFIAKIRRHERQRQTGADGTLVKDPKTGEYLLKKD